MTVPATPLMIPSRVGTLRSCPGRRHALRGAPSAKSKLEDANHAQKCYRSPLIQKARVSIEMSDQVRAHRGLLAQPDRRADN
jgi:hypothetical protein